MKKILAMAGILFIMSPVFAKAQAITTPYWCGWGWSSMPCTSYVGGQYGYPYNYSYNYNYPCVPLSYDSRGMVVQTSCGYVNTGYQYQNQYWYQPNYSYPYYSHYQWNWQKPYDWRDRERDWDRDHHRDWDHH